MPALRHRAAHYLLKKLGFFDRSYTEKIGGSRFRIPIINGRKTYASEEWLTEVIRLLLDQKAGGFVDVGVNLGQTLLKVASVDRNREYLGFEPNATCVDYVWKLIAENDLNFKIVPAGLAAQTELLQLEMFRTEDTDPSASIVPGFRENVVERRHVVVFQMDDLPESIWPQQISTIKIDVEGGELGVLQGVLPLLKTKRPFVVMEILPIYSSENHDRLHRQQAIEKLITDLDYRIFRIRRDPYEALSGLEAIEEIGIHGDLALSDYVMVPGEDVDALSPVVIG